MARPRRASDYRLWKHPENGVWYILWTEASGTKRKSTGQKVKADAARWRDQYIAGLLTPQPPAQPIIDDILTGYLEDRKSRVRSYQTLDYSCRPLRREIGNLEPQHLSNSVIRNYARARHLQGRQNGTIIRELVTLRAALKWARAESWVKTVPTFSMPVSPPPPKDRWLTKEEARKLADSASSHHVRLYINLALKTAARSGAIMDLRWSRVDLQRRLIDYGRGHGNKRRSTVPIDDELYDEILKAKELACTEYVMEFRGRRVTSIRTGFESACRRAALHDIGRHTLRHTAATWAVIAGVPLAEVARLMGDSEKMVERVYGKHSPEYLRRAVNSLAF